ncbi:hypothetical protein BDZ94DRAFT_1320578 [Collybia nuda]|uniref:Uncharacterized protein n=1 Tax=Collybia nuda TaxID=64659 RepID=A0A9P5Y954_9AGAR|nr:hypothetical protein BDZ94DRAFT_1320578 [Collybia nuda]
MLFSFCMLPRSQAPLVLVFRRLRWQARRTISTTTDTKRYRQDSSTSAADRHKLPMLKAPQQSAFVKTGKFLESPVQAFAVIRAVERKYGAVNEYHVAKDFEVETRYQSIIHLQFKDAESFGRIPVNNSDTFYVETPEALTQPGGVGLDELELFLERQEYMEEARMPAFGRLMDSVLQTGRDEADSKSIISMECKITRSNSAFWTPSSSPPTMTSARDMTGRNFIKWGGFQTIKPIKKETLIVDEELFGPTTLDHVRMRRILRKWSALSGAPNPYECSENPDDNRTISHSIVGDLPQGAQEARSDLSTWEPLPGYRSEPEDVLMPSTLDETPVQTRLASNAKLSSISCILTPSPNASEVLPSVQTTGQDQNFLPSHQTTIPAAIEMISPLNSPSNNLDNTTGPSAQAEKAVQLKAARAAANFNKTSFKKPQRKLPVKGPKPLPKKPRPMNPVQEEKENGGVAARLRGLFGF